MHDIFRSYRKFASGYRYPACAVGVWVCGLATGYFISGEASSESLSLMRMLDVQHVSIVWCFLFHLLLVVVSVLLTRYFSVYSVLPLVWLEGADFALCGCLLSAAYGDAAWLVRIFLLFSSTLFAPVFLLFIFLLPSLRSGKRTGLFMGTVFVSVMIGMIDYFAISPFWGILLN